MALEAAFEASLAFRGHAVGDINSFAFLTWIVPFRVTLLVLALLLPFVLAEGVIGGVFFDSGIAGLCEGPSVHRHRGDLLRDKSCFLPRLGMAVLL